MPEDFVIARNAEPGSTLPELLRVPLGDGIILKAKDGDLNLLSFAIVGAR